MHLIQDDLVAIGYNLINEFGAEQLFDRVQGRARLTFHPMGGRGDLVYSKTGRIAPIDEDSFVDLSAAAQLAHGAQTILFPSEVVEGLIARENHGIFTRELKLPFDHLVLQFTRPIDEGMFFPRKEFNHYQLLTGQETDTVTALLIGRDRDPFKPDDPAMTLNSVCAVYGTLSVNRVAWWQGSGQYNSDLPMDDNKLRLRYVAQACLLFLNARNVEIQKRATDPAVNRRRERKGKKPLKPYYTCLIRKEHYAATAPATAGSKHSFMYPVRGHIRHLRNGETVWVPPHFRGLEHADQPTVPKIYKVREIKP